MDEPSYISACILYILNRDTEPGGDGLTEAEITKRIKEIRDDEWAEVDRIFLKLSNDWEDLKSKS